MRKKWQTQINAQSKGVFVGGGVEVEVVVLVRFGGEINYGLLGCLPSLSGMSQLLSKEGAREGC